MKLDITTLGTFYRMAQEGAGFAAGRLTHMTDVETSVGVTKVHFVRGAALHRHFENGHQNVGVSVGLEGAIDGDSMVVLDRPSTLRILETLLSEDEIETIDDLGKSAVTEVGNIVNNGFVDGWADVLESVIDVSPPTYVEGTSAEPFLEVVTEVPDDDDLVLLFQSEIEAVGTQIGFRHYLFPERDSMAALLDRLRTGEGIAFEKLEGFDRMAERGAEEIAETATTLTGIETTVDVRRLDFVSLESIPQTMENEPLVGIAFEFDGTPSGFLLFVFDEDSARSVVDAMLPSGVDEDAPFDGLGQSAIMELGNIMASGLLDGWANVLGTAIDHSPPEFIHDIGPAAVDPVVIQLGEQQEYAFVFDTAITADGKAFDCEVFAIADEADLERALAELEIERIEETPTTAAFEEIENG